jgi:hypothetical protein
MADIAPAEAEDWLQRQMRAQPLPEAGAAVVRGFPAPGEIRDAAENLRKLNAMAVGVDWAKAERGPPAGEAQMQQAPPMRAWSDTLQDYIETPPASAHPFTQAVERIAAVAEKRKEALNTLPLPRTAADDMREQRDRYRDILLQIGAQAGITDIHLLHHLPGAIAKMEEELQHCRDVANAPAKASLTPTSLQIVANLASDLAMIDKAIDILQRGVANRPTVTVYPAGANVGPGVMVAIPPEPMQRFLKGERKTVTGMLYDLGVAVIEEPTPAAPEGAA